MDLVFIVSGTVIVRYQVTYMCTLCSHVCVSIHVGEAGCQGEKSA